MLKWPEADEILNSLHELLSTINTYNETLTLKIKNLSSDFKNSFKIN